MLRDLHHTDGWMDDGVAYHCGQRVASVSRRFNRSLLPGSLSALCGLWWRQGRTYSELQKRCC